MPNSSIKINQALATAIEKLRQAKNKFPHLNAEILLSHILKKPREYILAHPEKQLSKTQIISYQLQITKRAKGKPAAYITGHKEFYGLDFFVNKNVLIPRPETELMVDEALKILKTKGTRCPIGHRVPWIIIDVGTGSGCIVITLAKLLKKNLKTDLKANKRLFAFKSVFRFFATDISKSALTIARKNAKLHKVDKKITFLQGSLLKPIINKSKIPGLALRSRAGFNLKSEIIITANLPYLTPAQIKNSPSIKHEPKLALSAGPDGLKYYRRLFKQIKLFKIYDLKFMILVEIDPCQIIKIKQLVKRELPQSKIQIKKDLRGHDRLIIINIRNS